MLGTEGLECALSCIQAPSILGSYPMRSPMPPRSKGEMVTVNFGHKPWVFDLEVGANATSRCLGNCVRG